MHKMICLGFRYCMRKSKSTFRLVRFIPQKFPFVIGANSDISLEWRKVPYQTISETVQTEYKKNFLTTFVQKLKIEKKVIKKDGTHGKELIWTPNFPEGHWSTTMLYYDLFMSNVSNKIIFEENFIFRLNTFIQNISGKYHLAKFFCMK